MDQDGNKAIEYLKIITDYEDEHLMLKAEAMAKIAEIYGDGIGVEINRAEAERIFNEAETTFRTFKQALSTIKHDSLEDDN